MNCQECRERLSEYIDGRLPDDEARQVEAHLGSCAQCAREEAQLRATVALVAGLERKAAPAGFADNVAARLERHMLLAEPREPGRRLIVTPWRFAGIGVAAAAAFLVAVYYWGPQKGAVPRTAARPTAGEEIAAVEKNAPASSTTAPQATAGTSASLQRGIASKAAARPTAGEEPAAVVESVPSQSKEPLATAAQPHGTAVTATGGTNAYFWAETPKSTGGSAGAPASTAAALSARASSADTKLAYSDSLAGKSQLARAPAAAVPPAPSAQPASPSAGAPKKGEAKEAVAEVPGKDTGRGGALSANGKALSDKMGVAAATAETERKGGAGGGHDFESAARERTDKVAGGGAGLAGKVEEAQPASEDQIRVKAAAGRRTTVTTETGRRFSESAYDIGAVEEKAEKAPKTPQTTFYFDGKLSAAALELLKLMPEGKEKLPEGEPSADALKAAAADRKVTVVELSDSKAVFEFTADVAEVERVASELAANPALSLASDDSGKWPLTEKMDKNAGAMGLRMRRTVAKPAAGTVEKEKTAAQITYRVIFAKRPKEAEPGTVPKPE